MANLSELLHSLFIDIKYNKGKSVFCILTEHQWGPSTETSHGNRIKVCSRCRSTWIHFKKPLDLMEKMTHGIKCSQCQFEGTAVNEDEAEFLAAVHRKESGHDHVHVGPLTTK